MTWSLKSTQSLLGVGGKTEPQEAFQLHPKKKKPGAGPGRFFLQNRGGSHHPSESHGKLE